MTMYVLSLWIAMLASFTVPSHRPESGTLFVHIGGVRKGEGCLRIALYDNFDDFEQKSENRIAARVVYDLTKDTSFVIFRNLPYGRYALASYQDLNDNDKLDTNLLGIPTEPFAFSNNPRVKWSSPSFDEVVFSFNKPEARQKTILKRWKYQ